MQTGRKGIARELERARGSEDFVAFAAPRLAAIDEVRRIDITASASPFHIRGDATKDLFSYSLFE